MHPTTRPVFRQGDESNACYQLLTGSVGVYLPGGGGGEAKCVATMKAGDHKTCFGEIGLLEGARRSATLIAESDALQCAVIDRAAFDAIVKVQCVVAAIICICTSGANLLSFCEADLVCWMHSVNSFSCIACTMILFLRLPSPFARRKHSPTIYKRKSTC